MRVFAARDHQVSLHGRGPRSAATSYESISSPFAAARTSSEKCALGSARHQAKPAEVALAWVMAKPGVTAPIASATSVAQAASLVRATELQLSAAEFAAQRSGRLLVQFTTKGHEGRVRWFGTQAFLARDRHKSIASAPDIVALFRAAGIRVRSIKDMDAWLRRHAVFITAISGALCAADC